MIKLISCRFVPVFTRNPGNAMACSILIVYLLATEQVEVVGASRAEVKSERAVNSKQVSVQPRPSAVNVSYVRDTARICCCSLCCGAVATERRRLLTIDISCQPSAQQQTFRTPLLLSLDGTDRRMDGSRLGSVCN